MVCTNTVKYRNHLMWSYYETCEVRAKVRLGSWRRVAPAASRFMRKVPRAQTLPCIPVRSIMKNKILLIFNLFRFIDTDIVQTTMSTSTMYLFEFSSYKHKTNMLTKLRPWSFHITEMGRIYFTINDCHTTPIHKVIKTRKDF